MTQIQAQFTEFGNTSSVNVNGTLIGQITIGGNTIFVLQDLSSIRAYIVTGESPDKYIQVNGASSNLISVAWYDTFDRMVSSYNLTTSRTEYHPANTTISKTCTTEVTCDTDGAWTPNLGTQYVAPCSVYNPGRGYCAITSYGGCVTSYTSLCYSPVNVSTTALQEVNGTVLDFGFNLGIILSPLPSDMFGVVWSSCTGENVGCQVKLQIMSSAGDKRGEEEAVTDAAYNCVAPSIASNGEFLNVVASCELNGQSTIRLRQYQITIDGLAYIGSDFEVCTSSNNIVFNPAVSFLGNDTVVVYQKAQDNNNTVFETYAARFDSNNNQLNAATIISLSDSVEQPKMIPFTNGSEHALLVVAQTADDVSGPGIKQYILGTNQSGFYISDNKITHTDVIGVQNRPWILSLSVGYSLAYWSATNDSVRAIVLDPNGVTSGEEFSLADDVKPNSNCGASFEPDKKTLYLSCPKSADNVETNQFLLNFREICEPTDTCLNITEIQANQSLAQQRVDSAMYELGVCNNNWAACVSNNSKVILDCQSCSQQLNHTNTTLVSCQFTTTALIKQLAERHTCGATLEPSTITPHPLEVLTPPECSGTFSRSVYIGTTVTIGIFAFVIGSVGSAGLMRYMHARELCMGKSVDDDLGL